MSEDGLTLSAAELARLRSHLDAIEAILTKDPTRNTTLRSFAAHVRWHEKRRKLVRSCPHCRRLGAKEDE